jgi:hypothetical protein
MSPKDNNNIIPQNTARSHKGLTAGGKTFIACNAIHSIHFSTYDSSRPKGLFG